jgi:hypothetical protein
MLKNQIDTLTPNFFFSFNLYFKYSNESCEPILEMYVLRNFELYKEVFNPINFDPSNGFLKIWEPIEILTPKVGALGSVWAHSLTLSHTFENVNVTPTLHFRPTPFHALALVTSLRLKS